MGWCAPWKSAAIRCSSSEWFGLFTDHRKMILAAYDSQERGEALMLVAETQGFPVGQVWHHPARVTPSKRPMP